MGDGNERGEKLKLNIFEANLVCQQFKFFYVYFHIKENIPMATNSLNPQTRYQLQNKIGEGGFGYVCQAWDKIEKRTVAVKIVNLEDAADELENVHEEIAIMSNVSCPQLIKYYDSYVVDSDLWIVMEYLEAGIRINNMLISFTCASYP